MLYKILSDIKNGENLDIFITILLAIGLCTLDLTGIQINAETVNSLTIALLGIIAFSLLKQRYDIANIKINNNNESIFTNSGFIGLESNLTFEGIKKGIEKSNKRIHILDNWICENLNTLEYVLHEAIARNVEIKIAILNPDSFIAKQRTKDLGYKDENYVSNQILSNIDILKRIHDNCKSPNFQLRVYSSLPTIEFFVFDDEILFAPFLNGVESKYNPHILISSKSEKTGAIKISHLLFQNFNNVFNSSEVVF